MSRERMTPDNIPDRDLPGFKRFFSNDQRFPLSISYPQNLTAQYSLLEPRGLYAVFGRDTSNIYSQELAVTRWDFTQEGYTFIRGSDIYQHIQRDMDEFLGRQHLPHAAAIKYWIEWPGERKTFFKKLGRKPEHLGPALIGEEGMEVPRVVYLDPEHRYGERIYFLHPSDQPSVIWTLWRKPFGTLTDDTFKTILRSVRWISDGSIQTFGGKTPNKLSQETSIQERRQQEMPTQDPWKFIYDQTGYDPMHRYSNKENNEGKNR